VKIGRKKSLALVVLLALEERSVDGEYVAELLWPGNPSNRASLRTTLSHLNTATQLPIVVREGSHLQLNPTLPIKTDVLEIKKHVETYKRNREKPGEELRQLRFLEQAVHLWKGRLFAGFYLSKCPDFESWIVRKENELNQIVDYALSSIVRRYEELQDLEKAILYGRLHVDFDPSNEGVHRNLIQLYARAGQKDNAIRQYSLCKRTLKRELGQQPEEATEHLYRSVLSMSSVRKIAVLSFSDYSGNPDVAVLGAGISDEIRARLSQIYSLHVLSRSSTVKVQDSCDGVRAIGMNLNAHFILDGTFWRQGDNVRITTELIDAVEDELVWGKTYTGIIEEIFSIQDDITGSIITALGLGTSTEEHQRIVRRLIWDIHAYEAYLRARPGIWAFDSSSLKAAEQELINALQIVGPNELIYASLGFLQLQILNAGVSSNPDHLVQAEHYAKELTELNSISSYRYFLQGHIHYIRGELQQAVRELKQACLHNPNDPEALLQLSYIYMLVGKTAAAKGYLERLLEVDPLTPIVHCLPGFALTMDGDFTSAPDYYKKFFQMDPAHPASRLFYGWNLALAGHFDESWNILNGISEHTAQLPYYQASQTMKFALKGDAKAAVRAVNPELTSSARKVEYLARFLSDCFAMIGWNDVAIDWLEEDFSLGFCNYPYASRYNPFFVSLRKEERCKLLLRRMKKRWEEFEI
jgi:TolB-like protein/Tfp pilus assembly protein PilF